MPVLGKSENNPRKHGAECTEVVLHIIPHICTVVETGVSKKNPSCTWKDVMGSVLSLAVGVTFVSNSNTNTS